MLNNLSAQRSKQTMKGDSYFVVVFKKWHNLGTIFLCYFLDSLFKIQLCSYLTKNTIPSHEEKEMKESIGKCI